MTVLCTRNFGCANVRKKPFYVHENHCTQILIFVEPWKWLFWFFMDHSFFLQNRKIGPAIESGNHCYFVFVSYWISSHCFHEKTKSSFAEVKLLIIFFVLLFVYLEKKNDNDYKKQPIMRIWSTNKTKVAISDFRVGPAQWIWELIILQKLEWWFCSKLKLFSYIRWRDYVFFFPINSISKFDRVVM